MVTNRILVIAGMHRSGTSLITQWLYRCGLNIGNRVLGPLTGNEEGHFEDLDFVDAHKDFLKQQQLPDTGLSAKEVIDLPLENKETLKKLIQEKNQTSDQWGWKDPRTCLFLDAYNELLPDAKYLFIIRDHTSSVSSLIYRIYKNAEIKYLNRNWFYAFLWKAGRNKLRRWRLYSRFSKPYLKVWIMYNEKILKSIKALPESNYILLDYALLNKKDKLIFAHLKDQWNFSLDYVDFKDVYKGNLMNKAGDVGKFVRKKTLLKRAQMLEDELRSYAFE